MGNDGGSIPRRIELVKEKQKEVKQNPNLQREAAWFYCALSKLPLNLPIVADRLGKLYNQDIIIEYILDKSTYGDGDKICPYIKSMKDTIKLNLTPNPSNNNDNNNNNKSKDQSDNKNGSSVVGSLEKELKSQFICPVSMKEMNGKHRFVYLDSCGCVFAEQTLKEVSSKECLSCAKPFDNTNIITINPINQTEIDAMTKAMEEKKSKQKEKKSKKKRQLEEKDQDNSNNNVNKKKKVTSSLSSSTAASIVMDKVNKELAEKEKNKKVSSAIKSLYSDKNQPSKVKGNYLTMGTFNRYC
ncbi:unnamed protein product [Cunninghamella echinulata]